MKHPDEKYHRSIRSVLAYFAILLFPLMSAVAQEDDLTQAERDEIRAVINENAARLRKEGKLIEGLFTPVKYEWPVKMSPGQGYRFIDAIIGYVDHNPASPNAILDWNCGSRTYDLDTGYNHKGTDIRVAPYPWNIMDQNAAFAVAAAPGVIVNKSDGNYDRNCSSTTPAPVNAIYLQHADGSVSWYLHLKKFSLTTKEIGDTVEEGEYLGIIGSSGRSGRPHLHFEAYNPSGQLQDPFAGACNMMNPDSLWKTQEPYRVTRMNLLMTGSAPPAFSNCSEPEETFEKLVFQQGETIVPSVHIRDLLTGQTINFRLVRPDGSQHHEWSFTPAADSVFAYRFAQFELPVDAQEGRWTYQVTLNGETAEHYFYVGQAPNVSLSGRVYELTGNAIPYAFITVTSETTGLQRTARSNPFGYYVVNELPVGERYTIDVTSKGRVYNRRSIFLTDAVSDLDHFPR